MARVQLHLDLTVLALLASTRLAERLGEDFLAGIFLYTGTATLPFGPKLRALPVSAIWQL